MSKFVEPIDGMATRRLNLSLHGRSVHRPQDVPGHNVFLGFSDPGTGDAVDFFASARAPVYAIADGKITRWANDATKKEVVYLEGDGYIAVYAHVDNAHEKVGYVLRKGEQLGVVRWDLTDPHLHFELWLGGKAVSGKTPEECRDNMMTALDLEDTPVPVAPEGPGIVVQPGDASTAVLACHGEVRDGVTWAPVRDLVNAMGWEAFDKIAQNNRIYVKPRGE